MVIGLIMLSVSQGSIRPWQHVLEPLSGYLHIGQKLLEEKVEFGPSDEGSITVEEVVKKHWDTIDYEIRSKPS